MDLVHRWAMTMRRLNDDQRGLSTAELLGNAALAIAALVVIWGVLEALGVEVVEWIRTQILGAA
ncbi:MAG TPA: hypothetical protein VFZ06_12055 [Acidimicrobiia bacterium]|nr:hypothetical protein [Acidimicrobiia bacterium]